MSNNFSLPVGFKSPTQPNNFSLPVIAPAAPTVQPLAGQNLTTTSEAPATALNGTELVRIVQGAANARATVQQFATFISGTAASRQQRSITSSAALPLVANDSILNINSGTDLVPVVPPASSRAGAPLTFKNLPGSHVQTLTRIGTDTFDGVTTLALAAGASVTLVPYNDGVNLGYAIE